MSIYSIIWSIENIYSYMIIAYVFLSWLPNIRESVVGVLLGKLVEPYLSPFRKIIPPIGGMIDISPIVAIIALNFVARGIIVIVSYLVGFVS